MRAWDLYWFGPVAAIRPYLAMKAVLCLLAFDVWVLHVPVGWRYGTDGFNVAHFHWLDVLQPMPSPELYVGLMVAVGMLALVCVFSDPGRWARTLLALLYTYGWTMSLFDVYQHHYLLSLVLIAFVFFPRARALVVSRTGTPVVSAWAYALVGATLAITYVFAVVTKLEAEWQTGEVIRRLASPALASVWAWAESQGMSPGLFWQVQALIAIVTECVLVVGYALAPRVDDSGSRWLRLIAWFALAAAISLHAGTELFLRLQIGWFSYYMILIAAIYFLPSSLLVRVHALRGRPAAWLASLRSAVSAVPRSAMLIGAASVAAIVGGAGFAVSLPGAGTVGLIAASAVVGGALRAAALGRLHEVTSPVLATGIAAVLMWATFVLSSARVEYYDGLGRFLQSRGAEAAAMAAFEQARRYGSSRE